MKKFRTLLLLMCLFAPCLFAGCENSQLDTLSTPQNLTVETGGYIVFNEVDDAEYYVIDVDGNEIPVMKNNNYVERYIEDGVSYFQYNASAIFTLGKSYSIKVKAMADGMRDSSYSSVVSYTHTIPVDKVSNILINGTTLTWGEVTNADYYMVKVISPTDGDVADDSESVANNNDLATYQFSTNRFDFSKILNTVGEYKFYINAVSSNTNYSHSGYVVADSYEYTKTLSTPSGSVHKVTEWDADKEAYVDNWHLLVVVDANSNIIGVEIDGVVISREIVETEACLEIDNNILDVNLNLMFSGSSVDLTTLGQHTISFYTDSTNQYYLTSATSSEATFENTNVLTAPVIDISYDSSLTQYTISWSCEATDIANISQFIVYVFTTTNGIKTYPADAELTNNFIISDEDFVGVAVQAVGVGSYLTSALSNVKSCLGEETDSTLTFTSSSGLVVRWTSSADALYYVVEIDGVIYKVSTNSFDMSTCDYADNIIVYYIFENYVPYKLESTLTYTVTLATPTNLAFSTNSSNPYILTFTGSENAIGYYVYIKGSGSSEWVRYEKLFTTTTIDLSNYFSTEGDYATYSVKVQAVADSYSVYKDSDTSSAITVEHTKTLSAPTFYTDESGVYSPVVKETVSGVTYYYVMFYGVEGATSYTLMINYNVKTVTAVQYSPTYVYKIDVSDYLIGAGSYDIKVRALSTSDYINSSAYSTATYTLNKQLDTVTGIDVTENDGVYTLSFDLQSNAASYRVRIVKLNDSSYSDYLYELDGLSSTFTIYSAENITKYLYQAGKYYIYVTAIAKENGYYGDSNESDPYILSKLETLDTPTEIKYSDASASALYVKWTGDKNADYYVIVVTDPNGNSVEYKSYSTQYNINDSFTIEGSYYIKIKSVVAANSDASATYQSSAFCEADTLVYTYVYSYDYQRYAVYLAGTNYDFYIQTTNSASDLLGILWYHYLYGTDENYGLNLYVQLATADEGEDGEQLSGTAIVRNAILRLASDADDNNYYNFSADKDWKEKVSTAPNNELFAYLCEKLIELYPYGTAILSDVSCENELGSNVFTLSYSNTLSGTKVTMDETVLEAYLTLNTSNNVVDYANDYSYLSSYSRRSSNTVFKIDSKSSVDVTTTEQLLMAVQYGKKPNFVGNSEVAEEVYANAKAVLVAIVNDNMSDLEKAEAIFNWLSYAYNVNLYSNYIYEDLAVSSSSDLSKYGNRAIYYLEGVFYGLTNSSYAGDNSEYYDGEFYFGYSAGWTTSEAISKAFTLLCAIEGIETRVVNGTLTYGNATIDHSWNKIYLDVTSDGSGGAWYNVDIMLSDGVYATNLTYARYYTESHLYFLVSDSDMLDSSYYVSSLTLTMNVACKTNSLLDLASASERYYDYYKNSSFSMSASEINTALGVSNSSAIENYSLQYSTDTAVTYQGYSGIPDPGKLANFVINALIYGKYLALTSSSNTATIEIQVGENYQADTASAIGTYTSRLNTAYGAGGKISSSYSYTNDGNGNVTFVIVISIAE